MKKIVIFILIGALVLFLFFTKGTNHTTATTSSFKVLEKVSSDKMKIVGVDINNNEEMTIYVEDENTWNLIKVNTSYFIVYEENISNHKTLIQIEIME